MMPAVIMTDTRAVAMKGTVLRMGCVPFSSAPRGERDALFSHRNPGRGRRTVRVAAGGGGGGGAGASTTGGSGATGSGVGAGLSSLTLRVRDRASVPFSPMAFTL